MSSLYPRIYAAVCAIPYGRVSSYGRIAGLVGCGARQVGYALACLPAGNDVPWHRVINHNGRISPRPGGERQRVRLLEEGVWFDESGQVLWERFGWPGAEADLDSDSTPDSQGPPC